ncbi:MAG: hypothetical protein AAGA99_10195 [Actinomycetota bacterium]
MSRPLPLVVTGPEAAGISLVRDALASSKLVDTSHLGLTLGMDDWEVVLRHPAVSSAQYVMGGGPQGFGHAGLHEAVQRLGDDVRLIVLLRDPADRLLAHYRRLRLAREPEAMRVAFDVFVHRGSQPVEAGAPRSVAQEAVNASRYLDPVRRLLAALGDERLRFIYYETLTTSWAWVNDLEQFLGFEPGDLPRITPFPSSTVIARSPALRNLARRIGHSRARRLVPPSARRDIRRLDLHWPAESHERPGLLDARDLLLRETEEVTDQLGEFPPWATLQRVARPY